MWTQQGSDRFSLGLKATELSGTQIRDDYDCGRCIVKMHDRAAQYQFSPLTLHYFILGASYHSLELSELDC